MYKVRVTSSDGKPVTVTWQLDTHRKECKPYVLRELKLRWHLETPEAALDAILSWSKDRLIAHLSTFTAHDLRPPAMR